MYLAVLKQLGIMTVIVIAGFIFAKITKVGEKEQQFLSKMLLYFINPCLVFSSFNKPFELLKLQQLGFVILISILSFLLTIGVSILTTLFSKKNKTPEEIEQKKSYAVIERLAIVFTNCGFVGIPLINGIFGQEGVFYLMGYLVVFNVLLWTWGYWQMAGKINLKKIITNPNIIAVCCGLILFCLPFQLPEPIAKPISMIGDLNTAVAMVLIGILFSNFHFDSSKILSLVRCICVRLILCSIVTLSFITLVYFLFGNHIQNAQMMLMVVLICSMCPSATSVPSLSVIFGKDTSYASLLVSVSSLVCIITVPSFVALAGIFIR